MSGETSQDGTYIIGCTVSLAHVSSLSMSYSSLLAFDALPTSRRRINIPPALDASTLCTSENCSLMTCACSTSNTILMRSILECEGRVYRGYENIYCENLPVL
ncbi:hypothetical protein K439DRAFT_1642031 [Ramaria rubella]|nr:hypothetical protein K439DRAFT_1642031 [Ramaria rubella]